jgi:hypothetical protein
MPPTQIEKGEAKLAPNTEADAMSSSPVIYDIQMGQEMRRLTPEQIAGTYERYQSLNHKHMQLKPFVELGEALMKRAPEGADAQKVAQAIMMALSKNPHMGNVQQQQPQQAGQPAQQPQSNADISSALEKWEKENAVALPPGYKEMMQQIHGFGGALQGLQGALKHIVAQSGGMVDAARDSTQSAMEREAEVRRQSVTNNLNRVQQELQFPSEAKDDFQVIFSERGYTLADFQDYDLLRKVASDFKAASASPEMERLRSIHQRRQAFTGSLGGVPSGADGGTPKPSPAENRLGGMVDFAMKRRGLM